MLPKSGRVHATIVAAGKL